MSFENDFETYRQNMFPAMVEELANKLGVSANSVEALGVGFLPEHQTWVFAERDDKGEIIGLNERRYTNGKKFMVKGSKRGLAFIVNPEHGGTKVKYRGGKWNWKRCTKAYRCPICNRDHYCLVSRNNPSDPEAVICTKMSEGSERKIGDSGWLHIRRHVQSPPNAGLLPESELPVLLVEGSSDVMAAATIGFTAIGRPSDMGGTNFLTKLPLANRDVVAMGERDAGAGEKGMELCFSIMQKNSKTVTKLMPPEGIKDLRAWVAAGLTQEELLAAIKADGDSSGDPNVFPDSAPSTIARTFLEQVYGSSVVIKLHKYYGAWYEFVKEDNKYVAIEKDAMSQKMYQFLYGKLVQSESKSGPVINAYNADENKVRNILGALSQWCVIRDSVTVPSYVGPNDRFDPKDCVPCKNGWLDIPMYEKGKFVLHAPTPDVFNLSALPYSYDPDARSEGWDTFTDQVFEGDDGKKRLLQQWFGYMLAQDNTYEKMMLLTGRPRSGKSTAVETLMHTVGVESCAATSFKALASTFGMQSLIGKSMATISDSRTAKTKEARTALETILQITGGDPVYIDIKYGTPHPAEKLACRFTLVMNDLPALEDNTGALQARMAIIEFNKSFLGNEDRYLKRRLVADADAGKMLHYALQGLLDLRKSNQFFEPESCKEVVRQYKEVSSPMVDFTGTCLNRIGDVRDAKQLVYEAYKIWCYDNNMHPTNKIMFGRMLMSHYRSTPDGDLRSCRDAKGRSCFADIQVKDDTKARIIERFYS